MAKKVITDFDYTKSTGRDCIPLVNLNNFDKY